MKTRLRQMALVRIRCVRCTESLFVDLHGDDYPACADVDACEARVASYRWRLRR